MTVAAVDWNASRVVAVAGPMSDYPLPILFDPPRAELALAIRLQKPLVIGSAALENCRHSPQQICQGFLPYLSGHSDQGPRWQSGRESLDVRGACELIWRKLDPIKRAEATVLTVPGYFQKTQAESLRRMGDSEGYAMLGSLPVTLAAGLAGQLEQFWQRSVLVIDVDDYALTLAWVRSIAGKANLIESRSFPHLGLRVWKDRLINALSDLFVWQHRRDPRDVPQAEQSLFDQLDVLVDAAQQNRAIQLGVQGRDWFKHLLVHPEQARQLCQPLVNKAMAEADHLLLSCPSGEIPRGILLTHAAGRLPGLVEALKTLVDPSPNANTVNRETTKSEFHEEDFGESLLFQDDVEIGGVLTLAPDAPARAAHALAELFTRGALPLGHLETIVPLAPPAPVDMGPPRLHHRGRDYFLREGSFTVGSQFGCQLWFDKSEYPDVASKHCEIVFEQRAFTLYNRSREATLVNDRAVQGSVVLHSGDQIRLGLRGPVVRFLGKTMPRPVQAVYV